VSRFTHFVVVAVRMAVAVLAVVRMALRDTSVEYAARSTV
jgi:hypothetical protein